MNLPKLPHFFSFSWRKALVWALAGSCVVLATTAVFLLLLPTLLSSPSGQRLLRPRLEAALGRTVEWSTLKLSWREGVLLTDLRLGAGAAPLRRLHIEALETSFGLARSEIRPVQVFFNLRLSGLTAEVEPSPAGVEAPPEEAAVNPEEILTKVAAQLQEAVNLGWELPVDVRMMIDIGPVAVHYRDLGSEETAAVNDLHFALKIPSLLTAPINVTAAADLTVNGHRLPSFRLTTGISGLADINGRLRPAGARVDLNADLPGLKANLQGTLAGAGLAGGVRLQPAQLLPVIQPFVAAPLPYVTGILSATLGSEIVNAGDLRLRLGVQGQALTATGGPLGQRRAGPLSFEVTQQIVTDHRRDTIAIEAGQLLVPGMVEAHWQATVEHPLSKRRQLTATLGPLTIHLQPLLALGKPFLPADLPLTALDGRLECDSLAVSAVNGGQQGEISLRGLRLLVDRFAARLPAGELTGSDLRVEVSHAGIPLTDGFPPSAKLQAGWRLGALRMQGEQPLTLAKLAGQVNIEVDELTSRPASRFGIAARLAIKQNLSLASLRLPGVIDLSGIEETLQVGVNADSQGDLNIDLRSFALLAQGRPDGTRENAPAFRSGLAGARGEGAAYGKRDSPAAARFAPAAEVRSGAATGNAGRNHTGAGWDGA